MLASHEHGPYRVLFAPLAFAYAATHALAAAQAGTTVVALVGPTDGLALLAWQSGGKAYGDCGRALKAA